MYRRKQVCTYLATVLTYVLIYVLYNGFPPYHYCILAHNNQSGFMDTVLVILSMQHVVFIVEYGDFM